MSHFNVPGSISQKLNGVIKNFLDKSCSVSRGPNIGAFEFDLELNFEGQMKVNIDFLNGNPYFLLQIQILRQKIDIFCLKHFS